MIGRIAAVVTAALAAVLLVLGCGGLCLAAEGVIIYTKSNAPKAPAVSDLPLKGSVTQYGITWTFDPKAPTGQFVNGDYYVVGPVTITAIEPKPRFGKEVADDELDTNERRTSVEDRLRNGSMLNPPAIEQVALDSGERNNFNAKLAARLPLQMKPGDALVSSISLKLKEKPSFPYHSSGPRAEGDSDNSPTKVVAVLTCVAGPQPADAFRPSWNDRGQRIYLARDLKREQLPKLARLGGEPDPVKFAEVFQKPWFNPTFFGFDQPMENMPHYGQWVGQSVSDAGLVLCLDYEPAEKEKLLLNFVQVGIDWWGAVKGGHPGWPGWGGHGSGHKFPIVFAGFMLGDEEMTAPTRKFPAVEFGEDNQTRYGAGWTGAKVVFAGHSGISSATGQPPRSQWGPYEQMPPSAWDKNGQKNYQSEAYRRANTSCCWVGEALAMRLLGLEKAWNHDAFFDYVDRWMTEDDRPACEEINKYFKDSNLVNPEKDWCHEGYTGDKFVKPLWNKYRALSAAPTDGWKKAHENPPGPAADAAK